MAETKMQADNVEEDRENVKPVVTITNVLKPAAPLLSVAAPTFSSLKDDSFSSPSPKPFPSLLRTPTHPNGRQRAKTPTRSSVAASGAIAAAASAAALSSSSSSSSSSFSSSSSGVPFSRKNGPSIHEGCICSYKRNQNFSFQPEVGAMPPGMAGAKGDRKSVTQLVRQLSAPKCSVHDSSPSKRPTIVTKVAGNNAAYDSLSPMRLALVTNTNKRKSRSPRPREKGRRDTAAATAPVEVVAQELESRTAAVIGGVPVMPSTPAPSNAKMDASCQTSPEKDSQLAKQLQLQLLRTVAEHKKLDDQLNACQSKFDAETDEQKKEALNNEMDDTRFVCRTPSHRSRLNSVLTSTAGVCAVIAVIVCVKCVVLREIRFA